MIESSSEIGKRNGHNDGDLSARRAHAWGCWKIDGIADAARDRQEPLVGDQNISHISLNISLAWLKDKFG